MTKGESVNVKKEDEDKVMRNAYNGGGWGEGRGGRGRGEGGVVRGCREARTCSSIEVKNWGSRGRG